MIELRHEEFASLFGDETTAKRDYSNEDIAVELDTDALLPKAYIPADTDRYEIYKRLYNAHEQRQVDLAFDDMRDRFGQLPPEAEELLFAVRLRIAALPTGFIRIVLRQQTLRIELPSEDQTAWYDDVFRKILAPVSTMGNARVVQSGKRVFIEVQLGRREEALVVLERFANMINPVTQTYEEEY